jgi:lysophospholipase L1-like esterase
MGARSRLLLTLAGVSLLVVVAAGCKANVTKEVLFVNDSVTHQSIIAIVQEMNDVAANDPAGRYAPNFGSSVPGIGLRKVPGIAPEDVDAYWTAHLTSLLDHVQPEVIVVELGYNDCGLDLTGYGSHIDNFMANIPSGTSVHWLTMADVNQQFTCDETINAALNAARSRWANLSLLDFRSHMQGHPEWTVDGTHLNQDGQWAYASWLHDQLDAIYQQPNNS